MICSKLNLPTDCALYEPPRVALVGEAIIDSGQHADTGLTVVGVGASAGGLEALREFVSQLSMSGEFCVVIAQHLSPSHRSMLMELLARETPLEVTELSQNQKPRPNVVYITPPNRHVELKDGVLTIRKPKVKTGPQPSVDLLFASLALELEERAVGVIFSGTGSDGARGILAIKTAGGTTFAQDESAKYNGMPAAAIGTGCVDLVLPPAQVAKRIPLLLDGTETLHPESEQVPGDAANTYSEICAVIRTQCGIDFGDYRATTILRRLSKRMALLHLPNLEAYHSLLKEDPSEVDRVVRELLIGVTSFFRDEVVFAALAEKIEEIVKAKGPKDAIRVWVPGCSTGEEAYSIAILFAEAMHKLKKLVRCQIFASDVDNHALAIARRGVYPASIAECMNPDILERYFSPVGVEFSVGQQLRESIVFSRHNLIEDPPFSKLDLISCRNLFIYFTPTVQRSVLERFHYALNGGCYLVLGKSEAIGELGEMFDLVDRPSKIFRSIRFAVSPFRPSAFTPVKNPVVPARSFRRTSPRSREARAHEAIAKRFGPPTVIVDGRDKPVHISGAIKPYLQVPTGSTEFDVFSLVDEELRPELRALLLRARREHIVVRSRVHTVGYQGDRWQYRILAHPYRDEETEEDLCLIAFVTVRALLEIGEEVDTEGLDTAKDDQVRELEHELLAMREHLQTMVKELETSNEELQSLNEELQSSNEELQSTNEELETSNEELQSTNEELTTVNEELVVKSDALNEANSFQASILESVSNAVLVTDRNLKLQRFNAAAKRIFSVDDDSIGEPVASIKVHLRMPHLLPMIEETIRTGQTQEKRIRDRKDDKYFDLLVQACRNSKDDIIGAVLTLNDVSKLARTNARLRQSRRELADAMAMESAILNSAPAMIAVLDPQGTIISVNEAWREFGRSNNSNDLDFGLGSNYLQICELSLAVEDEDSEINEFLDKLRAVLGGQSHYEECRYACHSLTEKRWFKCIIKSAGQASERIGALVMHINITNDVLLEKSMAEARLHAEEANQAKSRFLANMSHELRTPLNAIIGFSELIGLQTFGQHSHPKYLEYGKDISEAAGHLLRMIKQILDLSKIESGSLELDETPVDIRARQESVFRLFRQSSADRQIKLVSQIPQGLPRLYADEGAVDQILINLIGNALKFTREDGKVICSAKVNRRTGTLQVTVADTGIGISEDDLARVAEPFNQVRSTLTSDNSGVGLGLSLVNSLARLHQASVSIDSKLGRGTRVRVTFPASRVIDDAESEEPEANSVTAAE